MNIKGIYLARIVSFNSIFFARYSFKMKLVLRDIKSYITNICWKFLRNISLYMVQILTLVTFIYDFKHRDEDHLQYQFSSTPIMVIFMDNFIAVNFLTDLILPFLNERKQLERIPTRKILFALEMVVYCSTGIMFWYELLLLFISLISHMMFFGLLCQIGGVCHVFTSTLKDYFLGKHISNIHRYLIPCLLIGTLTSNLETLIRYGEPSSCCTINTTTGHKKRSGTVSDDGRLFAFRPYATYLFVFCLRFLFFTRQK